MTEEKTANDNKKETTANTAAGVKFPLKWDDSTMTTTYANVCNVASTQEEVTVLFGTNQTSITGESNKVTIKLSDRIILSPFAAKRLMLLLNNIVTQYENRFGKLNIEVRPTGGAK